MPYCDILVKSLVDDHGAPPKKAGPLNYQLSQCVDHYLSFNGVSYDTLNDVIGALECLKLEVARRILFPYEDKKIKENGDVFTVLQEDGTNATTPHHFDHKDMD